MLLLLTILFRLSLSQLPVDTIEEAPASIAQFSANILRDFETQSRFSLVQEVSIFLKFGKKNIFYSNFD